ncbi:MAG TPA: SDR family oxidoreductase [Solirubrobacteraceae bacterium]|jgi:NAD(P)-dependent dehydrogenase (short-subunit alcohol dehydrogenase family)|nr:SDR family oxidoreductase [Solirubrobacteraceae bacterium]
MSERTEGPESRLDGPDSMQGRVALVTGGGSGMGRAAACAFAARGAEVVIADISQEAAEGTIELMAPGRGSFIATDVTKAQDAERAVATCGERFGRLDYLHNNAGVAGSKLIIHETSLEDWDRVVGINMLGAWLMLKYALLAMREQGHGSIVNMASVAAHTPMAGSGVYNAAKAGVLQLSRTAALENGDRGIRVNAIAPGMIATPMAQSWVDAYDTFPPPGPGPLERFGLPEEVASAVVWLCSDAASFVNGICLTVDGGWTATAPLRDPLPTDSPA